MSFDWVVSALRKGQDVEWLISAGYPADDELMLMLRGGKWGRIKDLILDLPLRTSAELYPEVRDILKDGHIQL